MTRLLLISFFAIAAVGAVPADLLKDRFDSQVHSESSYEPVDSNYDASAIAARVGSWTPDDDQNAWELSGLFEGDIMLSPDDNGTPRTGVIGKEYRWRGGIIPISFEPDTFNDYQIGVIKGAMKEYHEKTCLRFKPYTKPDRDYVHITGASPGCWSMVGREGGRQMLNLQRNGCVYHGIAVHELLHALGFYHQQSATDRDEYVRINWNNIQDHAKHNFNKYGSGMITDFGVGYDYGSVMHYSRYSFSKNGEPTITPLQNVEIGQRDGMSKKDVLKLNIMYAQECGNRKPMGSANKKMLEDSVSWLGQ